MIEQKNETPISVVIVAAGSSRRMGENKLLMKIYNETVLQKTLSAFDNAEKISEIILVCRQEDFVDFYSICRGLRTPMKIVTGGDSRTQSTLNGLDACSGEIIAIHDGARPMITEDVINAAIQSAIDNGAAIPVVPIKDTIKIVKDGVVSRTLYRNQLFAVQTPQVFRAGIIRQATETALESGTIFSDDASCVESQGIAVHTVAGSYDNIKITTTEDISLATLIVDRRGF